MRSHHSHISRRIYFDILWVVLAPLACLGCLILGSHQLQAGVVTTGNVEPPDPLSWTSGTYAYVGHTADGTMTVDGGSQVFALVGYLGHDPGVTGQVVVCDLSSKWATVSHLYVGYSGSGTLRVEAGAEVSSQWGYLGFNLGSAGAATVTGPGSKWTMSQLWVGYLGGGTLRVEDGAQVSSAGDGCLGLRSNGTATVTGPGSNWTMASDLYVGYSGNGTLRIDEGAEVTTRWSGYLGYDSGSIGMARVIGHASKWSVSRDLCVGYEGSGTLSIEDGGQLSTSAVYLGRYSGANGTATLSGAGSNVTVTGNLSVGDRGRGTLLIKDGAVVTSRDGYLGNWSGANGTATVTGPGSKWNVARDLYVGYDGSGTLVVSDGGELTASSFSISNKSLLAIDVGHGSLLSIGAENGTITNDGTVRLLAGAAATAGSQYQPIAAGTWRGTGAYQAVGGSWDPVTHVFTVSAVQPGASGTPVSLELSQIQRTLIEEPLSGWSVGASFLNKAGQINFTATAMTGQVLSDLEALLPAGDVVLGAWHFTASGSGYSPGDPVYLSFEVGPGLARSDLHLWHYDGSQWSSYTATDLSYAGQYASFTVTGFSGYAVSAVPEPGTLALLACGAAAMLLVAVRRRRPRA